MSNGCNLMVSAVGEVYVHGIYMRVKYMHVQFGAMHYIKVSSLSLSPTLSARLGKLSGRQLIKPRKNLHK